MRARVLAALLLVASTAGLLAACDDAPSAPADLPASWNEVTLPVPPGPAGRLAVRDATWCGRWYVAGGVLGGDGSSRPALWTSTDGSRWTVVPTAATDLYAKKSVLSTVACRGAQVAAVGAKSGGAHALPRTSSWYLRPDGTLVDVRAGFELFGGPAAVSVNRVAAGDDDWLIAGNRRSGAAVWVSPDATAFRLVDDDPALSSDAGGGTAALGQAHDADGWTVVGRRQPPGRISPVPLAWSSADGLRWQRQDVPAATAGFADLERVVPVPGGVVAVGLRDDRFGAWTRTHGQWRAGPAFGRLAGSGGGAPFVSGLATDDGGTLAAVSDGRRFGLWVDRGKDGWRAVRIPLRPPTNGDSTLTVAGDGTRVLLLADDGRAGRVWLGGGPR
ncbi:hypothetical protein [Marmoricola sp. RAF53]|uniref:hypothetical protein n=1 Tax=Marmoricola sp. RAF53 TaxID=3233059 RepID=UPI003F9BC2CD